MIRSHTRKSSRPTACASAAFGSTSTSSRTPNSGDSLRRLATARRRSDRSIGTSFANNFLPERASHLRKICDPAHWYSRRPIDRFRWTTSRVGGNGPRARIGSIRKVLTAISKAANYTPSSRSLGTTPLHTPSGPANDCRPRRNGNWLPEAGSEGKTYSWGDEPYSEKNPQANIWQGEFPYRNTALDGFNGTAPVKSFPSNGYGLFDMSGNVWEWCSDWYDPSFYARIEPKAILDNPQGPDRSFNPANPYEPQRAARRFVPLQRQLLLAISSQRSTWLQSRNRDVPPRLSLRLDGRFGKSDGEKQE